VYARGVTPDAPDDDDALLAAWRDGDRAAGQRLFARYYEPVARFFLNKAGEAGDELIQKTFLACVEGMPRFRGEGSFRSYVFAVAYRQLCRHWRDRGKPVDPSTASICALDPTASRVLVEREELRLLLAGLRELPLDLQVPLELHYWEQCSVVEIAAVLEIPAGTVKSRLRRGREALRAALERLAGDRDLAASTFHGLETWAQAVRDRVHRGGA
jgi:RNA polymerase sigma factor (sigma-70 family)